MRVLVLRPQGRTDELARELVARGLEPVVVPAIRLVAPTDWAPLDRALDELPRFDWLVFTSVNGVSAFFERLGRRGIGVDRLPSGIAAVGPMTKEAIEERGIPVRWVPERFTTEALGAELPGPPSNVCLVRAENAGTDLEVLLRSRGFDAERVDAYRSEPANAERIVTAIKQGVDAIAFTSASIVEAFVRAVGIEIGEALVCSIGPATSDALRRIGLAVDVEAPEHTGLGLAQATSEHMDGLKEENARTGGSR